VLLDRGQLGGVPGVLRVGHARLARGDGPRRRALLGDRPGRPAAGPDRRGGGRPAGGRAGRSRAGRSLTAGAGIQRRARNPHTIAYVLGACARWTGALSPWPIRERYSRYRPSTGAREVTPFGEQEKVD